MSEAGGSECRLLFSYRAINSGQFVPSQPAGGQGPLQVSQQKVIHY